MTTNISTGVPQAATVDPTFDADNHPPFAPLIADEDLLALLDVSGWETEGYVNQMEAVSENYELVDGEWEHTETESLDVDYHYITWVRDAPLPGYPNSERSMVIMEYSDSAGHFENGKLVAFAPGYEVTAFAGMVDNDSPVGEYALGTFSNLAAGLEATLTFLARVATEETPESFTPPETKDVSDVLTALGLPEFDA